MANRPRQQTNPFRSTGATSSTAQRRPCFSLLRHNADAPNIEAFAFHHAWLFLVQASPKTRFHRGPALEISSTAFKLPLSPSVNNRIGQAPTGNRQSRSRYSLYNKQHLHQTIFRYRLRHANIKFAIGACRPIDLAQTNHQHD
ncbi:hypothetical protein [Burkholderia sp. TSV86]|uniref:hypothetical protein n=1 Tax=Burkholderia sp. TSV86 TaxID=1385594 RepID=UPI000B1B13F8|nr:hypothetical protein [Burkholderia sp. TSV86]